MAAIALRVIGKLERYLADDPENAGEVGQLREARDRLTAEPGRQPPPPGQQLPPGPEETTRLARQALDQATVALGLAEAGLAAARPLVPLHRPGPAILRSIVADLHQALAGPFDDTRLRYQVDRFLGICQAELYWADPANRPVQTLDDAIVHLNRALASSEHALPTAEWAGLLDALARCYHEVARRDDNAEADHTNEANDSEAARKAQAAGRAERTARAALRELARSAAISETMERALRVATQANGMAARAVGWCLADGKPQAAIDIAEAGRGLVLASVTMSGQVEAILRRAGKHNAADAWLSGAEAGRATALDALADTTGGSALLIAPPGDEISLTMTRTPFDAVAYLVPPAEPAPADAPGAAGAPPACGYVVFLRPVTAKVEVIPLPALNRLAGTPLSQYLSALGDALGALSTQAAGTGFRGGPRGSAWTTALEELGRWTYDQIMGPLLAHVRGWHLDHLPHLALIPLGQLAAIPYAAAWTDSPVAGEMTRRYAIDDVVLSYAASARLLVEVSRRPRQRLDERVVLVPDATGEFYASRHATRELASRMYRGAKVYGVKRDQDGPATTAALLGALPAGDRPGASLLHLTTHGTLKPKPALQTRDGWLPLARILEQARGRAPDAPGGLVITNACLSDAAQADAAPADYDESLTLATAFLAAGATAVIGTRWPVDDDTTAALALRIHYQLQRGYPPAEALRRAQLDLLRPGPGVWESLGPRLAAIEQSRLSHPASWAGHVHHGI
jgi:CHAT domain-containing protein